MTRHLRVLLVALTSVIGVLAVPSVVAAAPAPTITASIAPRSAADGCTTGVGGSLIASDAWARNTTGGWQNRIGSFRVVADGESLFTTVTLRGQWVRIGSSTQSRTSLFVGWVHNVRCEFKAGNP